MGKKQTVELLIEGGKATGGPPVGPALGPLKIPIPKVVAEINEKTKDFAGMQVPVKIIVDVEEKTWEIVIGTPPTSQLIKNELKNILPISEKKKRPRGAQQTGKEWVGNLTIEQLIKIARMKKDGIMANSLKAALKEISGTCLSMGIKIDNLDPKEFKKRLEEGYYDNILKNQKF